MPEKMHQIKRNNQICTVLLDRMQFVVRTWTRKVPHITGFEVCRDSFVRPQTAIRTYGRVRNLKNLKTGTEIYAQYWAEQPWLEPVKLTAVGDDSRGLQRAELETICGQFRWTRLLTVELALDFGEASEVDRSFVLRHGIFGRSQLVRGRFFKDLRYGTRHSGTMVRAYKKPETGCFRVEVELHSAWLRKNKLNTSEDLSRLSDLLIPDRLCFVEIDWEFLSAHLSKKGLPAKALIKRAQSKADSLGRVLSFLRHEVGLSNVRRFVRPLEINKPIQRQLRAWAERWRHFKQEATNE
jgi:hypothetical protein